MHLGACKADVRVLDLAPRAEPGSELGKRRGVKAVLGPRLPERLEQLAVVEGGEQQVLVADRAQLAP